MIYTETERLFLRKVLPEDYPYFRNYLMDKEMDRLMFRTPCETEEDVKSMFSWFLYKEKRAYVIVHRGSGQTIGNLTVYECPPSIVREHPATKGKTGKSLSFAMGRQWQRQGYMCEALCGVINKLFSEENVDYINSGFLSFNEPSRRLHEKLGFAYLTGEEFEVEGERISAEEMILHQYGPVIREYTNARIPDVLRFEQDLRAEESFWGWEIDESYIRAVKSSFEDNRFASACSLLAYVNGKVVGRIDASKIYSHFDGSVKAYLDWICVLKSYRHKGIAQSLMKELRKRLKEQGITTMIGLIASNEDTQRFYRSLPDTLIRDEGIWIDI